LRLGEKRKKWLGWYQTTGPSSTKHKKGEGKEEADDWHYKGGIRVEIWEGGKRRSESEPEVWVLQ